MEDNRLFKIFEARGLSKAEKLVAKEVLRGLSYKIIADNMCLSVATVKYHNTQIFKKFKVASKSEFMFIINSLYSGEITTKSLDSNVDEVLNIKKEIEEIKKDLNNLKSTIDKSIFKLPSGR